MSSWAAAGARAPPPVFCRMSSCLPAKRPDFGRRAASPRSPSLHRRPVWPKLTKRFQDDGFGSSGSDSDISDEDDKSEADDHIDEISKVL